jgi:hypothetical protein
MTIDRKNEALGAMINCAGGISAGLSLLKLTKVIDIAWSTVFLPVSLLCGACCYWTFKALINLNRRKRK